MSSWDYAKRVQKRAAADRRYERLQAARALGTHTKSDWLAILDKYDYRCVRCGYGEADTDWRPCKDHIVSLLDGGSDAVSNLQPLCRQCNTAKGGDATDWRAHRDQHGWADAEYRVS